MVVPLTAAATTAPWLTAWIGPVKASEEGAAATLDDEELLLTDELEPYDDGEEPYDDGVGDGLGLP